MWACSFNTMQYKIMKSKHNEHANMAASLVNKHRVLIQGSAYCSALVIATV
jgi:hypothetical protein